MSVSCVILGQNIKGLFDSYRVMKLNYQGYQLDWLAQWILAVLDHSDGFESVQSLTREFDHHSMVTESKIRRRLRRLEDSNMVTVSTEPRSNIHDRKLYRLNDDGSSFVSDNCDELDVPIHLHHQSEIEYLMEETEVLEHYVRQLIELEVRDGTDIEPYNT